MSGLTILLSLWAFVLLAAVIAWASRRVMFAFEIRIRDGVARLKYGRPRAGFLVDVQEIADRNGLSDCKVRGVGSGRAVRLSFAGRITDEARQQMRNAWVLRR